VPSTDAARQALRSTIDKGKEDRLRVVSIQKTDGRAMEFMGMKAYVCSTTLGPDDCPGATLTADGVAGQITLAKLQGYLPDKSPTLSADTMSAEVR